jgi:hypothetical protein
MPTKRIYPGYDIPGYHERLSKSIRRYGLPRGAPRAWLRDVDFQAWNYLGCMQPSGAMYWQCYLFAALQAAAIDQCPDLSTITILDQLWHFGERNWNFAPAKIEYQVRRALKGLNYIVAIEFETFRNVRYLGPPPRKSGCPPGSRSYYRPSHSGSDLGSATISPPAGAICRWPVRVVGDPSRRCLRLSGCATLPG